jgi:hypothetical protein
VAATAVMAVAAATTTAPEGATLGALAAVTTPPLLGELCDMMASPAPLVAVAAASMMAATWGQAGICFYHYSYDQSANRCKPPCLFTQGNGQAAVGNLSSCHQRPRGMRAARACIQQQSCRSPLLTQFTHFLPSQSLPVPPFPCFHTGPLPRRPC